MKLAERQAPGARKSLVLQSIAAGKHSLLSYLDAYNNATGRDRIINGDDTVMDEIIVHGRGDFVQWTDKSKLVIS